MLYYADLSRPKVDDYLVVDTFHLESLRSYLSFLTLLNTGNELI